MQSLKLSEIVINWYKKNLRILPWRPKNFNQKIDPYIVFLSEFMLQQTTVKTVIPYFINFLEKYPTIEILAKAKLDDVLAIWSGLGYYRRANNLYKSSKIIINELNGVIPNNYEDLIKLPGIGDYTAAAICAIAFDKKVVVIDGNIERILLRVFDLNRSEKDFKKKVRILAQKLTPLKNNKDYFQSLMDLANTICKNRLPQCVLCPINKFCKSNGKAYFKPKNRIKRSTKAGVIFLVRFNNKFLAGKSKKKILQGLYEFPTSEYVEYQEIREIKEIYQNQVKKWKKKNKISENFRIISTFEHNFSHFQLKVLMVEILLNKKRKLEDFLWFSMSDFEKKPISKLMSKAQKNIL